MKALVILNKKGPGEGGSEVSDFDFGRGRGLKSRGDLTMKIIFCPIDVKLGGKVVLDEAHLMSKGFGDICFRFQVRGI